MSSQTVRRRHVFYIPGYDPFPPRRYRELYRKESAAQAEISGYQITLDPQKPGDRYGWHVRAVFGDIETASVVETLVWSDLVRASMDRGVMATYLQLFATARTYISTGALFRLMRLRKGPVIAAFYPVAFLLVQFLLALLLAWGVGTVLALVHPLLFYGGVLIIPFVLAWFRKQDHRFFAYYLMHDYAYSAQANGANPPALEARMAEFADAIAEALKEDSDEVLVVGHSSGAHLAVSILADLIRQGRVPGAGPTLSFLSLGQVVPMVSFLPDAHRLRRDLQTLSTSDALTWIDVAAPGDGCAFALCDPVSVSGVATEAKRWPLVLSAAFSQTLSPGRWKELRWRFFRLHFQYLCAFDQPGDYDYFQITAGPQTLAERFKGRSPSKSRIETPTSAYTGLAP